MKKLMFAAAAIAAGVAVADITSANIVGFGPSTLRENCIGAGASFLPISSEVIDLTDLAVVGYEGDCEGVSCQVLSPLGAGLDTYFWYDFPGDDIYGWFDAGDNQIEKGAVTFKAGEAFWVTAPADGYNLRSSGQVSDAPIAVTLRENCKMICNPNPVDADLTAVAIKGYEGDCEGVSCQELSPFGAGLDTYFWYDFPGDEIYGWFDAGDNQIEAGAVTINPGKGVWVTAPSDAYTMEFPAAIEK